MTTTSRDKEPGQLGGARNAKHTRRRLRTLNKQEQQQKLKSGQSKSRRRLGTRANQMQQKGGTSQSEETPFEKQSIFETIENPLGNQENLILESLRRDLPSVRKEIAEEKNRKAAAAARALQASAALPVPSRKPSGASEARGASAAPPVPGRRASVAPQGASVAPRGAPDILLPRGRIFNAWEESAKEEELQDMPKWNNIEVSLNLDEKEYTKLKREYGSIIGQMDIKSENYNKNRYNHDNIRPHVERQLAESLGYINASPITLKVDDGPKLSYIATQCPKIDSFNDFWNMILHYNVPVICMVTNLTEGGRLKCHKYYPDNNKTFGYGNISVKCTSEEVDPHIVRRTFELVKGTESHTVKHLHYTAWPDHGYPSDVDIDDINGNTIVNGKQGSENALIELSNEISMASNGKRAPPVIHCSAGVGRTGSIIAINYLLHLEEIKRKSINTELWINIIKNLRCQRTWMVQSLYQYKGIIKTVLQTTGVDRTIWTVNDNEFKLPTCPDGVLLLHGPGRGASPSRRGASPPGLRALPPRSGAMGSTSAAERKTTKGIHLGPLAGDTDTDGPEEIEKIIEKIIIDDDTLKFRSKIICVVHVNDKYYLVKYAGKIVDFEEIKTSMPNEKFTKKIYITVFSRTHNKYLHGVKNNNSILLKDTITILKVKKSTPLFKALRAKGGGAMMLKKRASTTSAQTLKTRKIGKKHTLKKH